MNDPEERNPRSNILRKFSVPIRSPYGGIMTGHFREYIQFDPEQMVRETKISLDPLKEQHIAKATKGAITITFSVMREHNMLTYYVTLSGPDEKKEAVVKEFQKIFGESNENVPWVSVSFFGALKRDSYVWQAVMRKAQ